MTTNTLPRFRSDHVATRCYGTNHKDEATKGMCGMCGRDVVKTDKGRILDVRTRVNANDRVVEDFACWQPAHTCDTIVAARYQAEYDAKLADGELIYGQRVIVARGRKIAKGTIAIIRYVDMENAWGPRVGLKIDGEEALQYTAMKNVDAMPVTDEPTPEPEIAADEPVKQLNTLPARPRSKSAASPSGSHAACTHEATKSARAACRKARNS